MFPIVDISRIPVFLLCRDRVLVLKELIRWLEKAGLVNIYIIDIDSSYQPFQAFLNAAGYPIFRLQNDGPWKIWEHEKIKEIMRSNYYVVSDSDVVPDEFPPPHPHNAIERFLLLLERYQHVQKVGFGLRIDDIPDRYTHKMAVLRWEARYWRKEIEPGVYEAPIDTTFALYRPSDTFSTTALRTGAPYLARHMPWYLDVDNLPDDEKWYQERANPAYGTWHNKLRETIKIKTTENPIHRAFLKYTYKVKKSLGKRLKSRPKKTNPN